MWLWFFWISLWCPPPPKKGVVLDYKDSTEARKKWDNRH